MKTEAREKYDCSVLFSDSTPEKLKPYLKNEYEAGAVKPYSMVIFLACLTADAVLSIEEMAEVFCFVVPNHKIRRNAVQEAIKSLPEGNLSEICRMLLESEAA